jgi:hypothetical protein
VTFAEPIYFYMLRHEIKAPFTLQYSHFGHDTLKFWHVRGPIFVGHGTPNFCRVSAKLRVRGLKILSGPRPPHEPVRM